MGNITVRLAKQHVDCHDNCRFLHLMHAALMSRSNVAESNTCMI